MAAPPDPPAGPGAAVRSGRGPVDLVLVGGVVLSMDDPTGASAGARASALAIRGGTIAALGTDHEVLALAGPSTRRIHLAGRAILPGFQDAHAHPLAEGVQISRLDLTGTKDRAAALLLVRQAAAANRDPSRGSQWVEGRYHTVAWPDDRHPTREELDRAAPDVPVLLRHGSGHAVVANSLALALAGVTASTADPPGATIERGPDGEPSGLVLGAEPVAPFATALPPLGQHELLRAARQESARLLADGVTAISDANVGTLVGAGEEIAAYAAAVVSGGLAQRTTLMPGLARLVRADEDPPAPQDIEAMIPPEARLRLRVGPAKHFSDGAFTTGDAWLRAPYADAADRPPELRVGRPAHPDGELAERLRRAHRAGWQLATHAIGDAAIAATLAAYRALLAETPRPDHRHRIEHAMLMADDLLREMIALDVLAVLQPEFIAGAGDAYRARVGPERQVDLYAYRRWLDAGLRVAFGTDRPVTRGRPLDGIRSAMRHAGPSGIRLADGQEPTVAEALHAWTAGAAFAARDETRAGRLLPGLAADLVVLSGDPTAIPAERWAAGTDEIEVVATMVDGRVAHGERALD